MVWGAVALFLAVGWWLAGAHPAEHEEVSAFPHRGAQVMVFDGERMLHEPSCADPEPPGWITSQVRPAQAVCMGGLTLPILIAPYASGLAHWHALLGWPLHQGDVFAMRRWNLLVGVISLVLFFMLVRRLKDPTTATVATMLVAVSPPFMVLYSLLIMFEVTPWLLTMAAVLVALGPRPPPSPETRPPWRPSWGLVGVLVGLAIAANVKATFYLPAIGLVAWRMGAFTDLGRREWATLLVGGVAGCLPLWGADMLQPASGIGSESSHRLDLLLQPTSLSEIWDEMVNLVRFGTDTGSYTQAAWAPLGVTGWVAAFAMGGAVAYAIGNAFTVVLRRKGDPVAAVCGLLAMGFMVISLKLYDQRPAANYAPLQGVFALILALPLVRLGRWVAAKAGSGWVAQSGRTSLLLAAVLGAVLLANGLRRMDIALDRPLPTHAAAERQLVDWLLSHPEPDTRLFTTTYNLAGVLDALGHGELSTTRLENALSCGRDEACVQQRWTAFLKTPGLVSARIVLPTVETLTDEADALFFEPALKAAARAAGASFQREFVATAGPSATPVLALVRVDRPRPQASP